MQDALDFLSVVGRKSSILSCEINQDPVFPDVDAILSVNLSLFGLQQIAGNISDPHIIQESIEIR